MSKQPTIQINIGTIEVSASSLDNLISDIQDKIKINIKHESLDKSIGASLSESSVDSVIDILRDRIASLENRLDTQDEPLKDIIDEVSHEKPNLKNDLENIKKQLDAAELEEIIIGGN
tara:strand:+ start:833 stop:1186 length:354 start_codon:yes stop_codon:yes gene_type:complete